MAVRGGGYGELPRPCQPWGRVSPRGSKRPAGLSSPPGMDSELNAVPCFLTPPRTHGECCCPHKHTSEADPPAANGSPLTCAPRRPSCCLPRDAAPDTVAGAAGPARPHGAAPPEAEPHHPHPEAAGPGPRGDPAGAGVQVRVLPRAPRPTGHALMWFTLLKAYGVCSQRSPSCLCPQPPSSLGQCVSFQRNRVCVQADRCKWLCSPQMVPDMCTVPPLAKYLRDHPLFVQNKLFFFWTHSAWWLCCDLFSQCLTRMDVRCSLIFWGKDAVVTTLAYFSFHVCAFMSE